MPTQTIGSDPLLRHSGFTLRRLHVKGINDLCASLQEAHDALTKAADATVKADEVMLDAVAARNEADTRLGALISRLSTMLLLEVGKRSSAVFQSLLGEGPTALRKLGMEDRLQALASLEARSAGLALSDTTKAQLVELIASRDALLASIATYKTASASHTGAFGLEVVARENVRKALRRVFGELTGRYPDARPFVESFFLERNPGKKAAAAPAEAVESLGAQM